MLPLSDSFEDPRSSIQLTLAARVGLREVLGADEDLLEQWFGLSDIEATWGSVDDNLRFARNVPLGADQRIISLEGEAVGYIRWSTDASWRWKGTPLESILSEGAIRVDVLVGPRDRRMVGLGSVALQRVRSELAVSRGTMTLFGLADVQNLVARRAFEKAGFLHHYFYDDGVLGPSVAMVCLPEPRG